MTIKKLHKALLKVGLTSFLAGLLAANGYAAGTAVGAGASVKPRVNPAVSMSESLRADALGVKQFEVLNNTTGQVVDEAGTVQTTGEFVSIELSTGPSDNSCYVLVYDSASVNGLATATTGRALIPPVIAQTSATTIVEFDYPKQFHRGLAVLVSNPSSGASCRATIGWRRNGGSD